MISQVTSRRRGAMTLVELLVAMSLGLIVIGILYKIWHQSIQQEKVLSRQLDMQRSLRGSMALIQHDLRELLETVSLERDPNGSLLRFEFKVFNEDGFETVRYELEKGATPARTRFQRTFQGRTEALFQESLIDCQIYPFRYGNPPDEVKDEKEISRTQFFRVKLTFIPGKNEFKGEADARSFAFQIYPRVLASRYKSVYGRFQLLGSRFGQATGAPGSELPPPPVPEAEME